MAKRSRGRQDGGGKRRTHSRDPQESTNEVSVQQQPLRPDQTPPPLDPDEMREITAEENWPPNVQDYSNDGETARDSRGVSPDDLGDLDPDVEHPQPDTGERALGNLPDPWKDGDSPPRSLNQDPGPTTGTPTKDEPLIEPLPDSAMIIGSIETHSADKTPLATHERPVSIDEHAFEDVSRTRSVKPTPKRMSSGKVISLTAAIALVLLGTFVVAGIMFSNRSGKRSRQKGTGSILVRTEPAAACTVFINGRPTELLAPGNSMLLGDLPAKQHDVSVRCVGYQPFDRKETVKPDEVTLLNASLRPETSESSQKP